MKRERTIRLWLWLIALALAFWLWAAIELATREIF